MWCLLQGFDFGKCCGSVKIMDINKTPTVRELNITNRPLTPDFMASPHGMSTWRDPKTGRKLDARKRIGQHVQNVCKNMTKSA